MLANRYQTFWQRVKSAFKFVFKKEPIWIGDSLVIDEKRIKEFEDVLKVIKKNTRWETR
jgi:hypothetical protein